MHSRNSISLLQIKQKLPELRDNISCNANKKDEAGRTDSQINTHVPEIFEDMRTSKEKRKQVRQNKEERNNEDGANNEHPVAILTTEKVSKKKFLLHM